MNEQISRRTILGIAAGSALGLGLIGAGRARGSTLPPRVPDGVRLRGANAVGSFDVSTSDTIWGGYWRNWDWDGLIRPQLEDIASVANSVRFWGNTLALSDGSVTTDDYLSRWQQVLDYCKSLALFVYPCGGDLRHWGSFSWAQSTSTYRDWAALLSDYSNVIGVDITNEASSAMQMRPDAHSYHEREPAEELLGELGNITRQAGMRVAHSRSIHSVADWGKGYPTDAMGDFLDFHVYYSPAPEDSTQAYQYPWGHEKQLVIGEFGKDTGSTSESRKAYYEAIRAMCANDSRCIGVFAWSAWDLGSSEKTQWGLFDKQGSLRADIGEEFLKFPIKST